MLTADLYFFDSSVWYIIDHGRNDGSLWI